MARALRSPVWPLVAVLGLLFLAYDLGAKQVAMSSGDMWLAGVPGIRIEYIPDPNDIVNLAEGTPYTVPAGKVLIITDWVTTDVEVEVPPFEFAIQPRIKVNGTEVWGGGYASGAKSISTGTLAMTTTGTATLTGALRSGVRADSGDTVTLETFSAPAAGFYGNPRMFASGYLAKAK